MSRKTTIRLRVHCTFEGGAAHEPPTFPRRRNCVRAGLRSIQTAPGRADRLRLLPIASVEIVSLCDVESKMLNDAAVIVASRQASRKRPRLFHDYRDMLKERDLDIVEVATPDHWHALPTIAALQAGADVYCQKPISVDVVEGQAMLAAARKYKRVVQIGTQRRSTPHLAEAREQFVQSGRLGKVGLVEIYSYYKQNPRTDADTAPPPKLDYEFWTGPAPMRPYNPILHPRSWRAFMEYGNGTVGDMAVHMLDMARWMLDLGWPKRIASSGGILVNKNGRANIADTQTATFEFDGLNMVWNHRHWGAPPDPKYVWGATFYGDKGTLKASVFSYDFVPDRGEPVHKDVTYELDKFPEDNTEPQIEKHVAPAIRYHMKDFLAAIDARSKPIADIEQGYISSSCCILANVAMKLGRTLEWDAAAGKIKGDEEANRLLRRPYRSPWVHPEVDHV